MGRGELRGGKRSLYRLNKSWISRRPNILEITKVWKNLGPPLLYRPFPSSLVPLFQNESKYETIEFHMKMSSAWSFIFKQIKVIFIMVSHLDSLWNRGTRKLRKWPIQMREFDGAWERGRHNRVKIKGLVYKRMANSLTSGSCPV